MSFTEPRRAGSLAAAAAEITPQDFAYVRTLAKEHAGFVLDEHKKYLVDSRLSTFVRDGRFATIGELVEKLRLKPFGDLHREVLEALAIHETLFFRDRHPFDTLKDHVIPDLVKRRGHLKRLHFWSAACSTGQEPYTMAMVLKGSLAQLGPDWTARIVASDFSEHALRKTREATYSNLEVRRGLPSSYVNYFDAVPAGWKVKPTVTSMVELQQINLTKPLPHLPQFDVVFLRNVLIYFDRETKAQVLEQVRRVLNPDGYLFLGSSETLVGVTNGFERVRLGVTDCYRPRGA